MSRYLLVKYFDVVDLLEPSPSFLKTAKFKMDGIGASAAVTLAKGDKFGAAGQFLNSSLQDVALDEDRYSVVWTQWTLCYLTDGTVH